MDSIHTPEDDFYHLVNLQDTELLILDFTRLLYSQTDHKFISCLQFAPKIDLASWVFCEQDVAWRHAVRIDDTAMITPTTSPPKWRHASFRLSSALKPRMKSGFDDPRWRLVQRMVASRGLGRSTLLSNFLLFVCDRYLSGKIDEITEQQIGIHVFGRVAGYNSGDDNIVRSYARTLRKRIEDYFATEGKEEGLAVTIPRGGYVPVFSSRDQALSASIPLALTEPSTAPLGDEKPATSENARYPLASSALSADETPQSGKPRPPSQPGAADGLSFTEEETFAPETFAKDANRPERGVSWRAWSLYALAALCAVAVSLCAGYLAARKFAPAQAPVMSRAARAQHLLWSQIFEPTQDTFVVSADGGLVMLQSFMKHSVSLADYANGNYKSGAAIDREIGDLAMGMKPENRLRLAHKIEVLGNRRYTSVADLDLTTSLARLKEVVPERLMIRFARDLRIDDLRTGNAILLGSPDANPWVELFQKQLNFQFSDGSEFGGSPAILNQHPLSGERTRYASEANDPLLRTYGLIAYVPNLGGTGHVLIIEGVNMAGTQAAGVLLLNPDEMEPLLERAMSPNGVIRPFEVLIETRDIAANASRPSIVSMRMVGF
jgi:hypothetical protein